MKILISVSAKQVGVLYHYTDKDALLKILRTGKVQLSMGRGTEAEQTHQKAKVFFFSLTRSRFGSYHYKEGGKRSLYGDTAVMLTIDGNRVSENHKVIPVDYWQDRGRTGDYSQQNKEVEERLISNRDEIPFLKYIKRVDFIQPAALLEKQTYGMDRGKTKVHENEALQRQLGSIILQLKKRKIPYAFYDSMKDWALKRGEYEYIGQKGIEIKSRPHHPLSFEIEQLVAIADVLSNKPYEKLSKHAQDIAYNVHRYPHDIDSVLNTVTNNRKPDVDPYVRKLIIKISKMLGRLGLKTKKGIAAYIGGKYKEHYQREEDKRLKEQARNVASLCLNALENSVEGWTETKAWYAPKNVLLDAESPADYEPMRLAEMVDDAFGYRELKEVKDLELGMARYDLETGRDLVLKLFYWRVADWKTDQKIAAST